MVAPIVALSVRGTAEFARPEDERILQQPARVQIAEQPRDRFVDRITVVLQCLLEVEMLIPVAMRHLDETHSRLDQSTSHKAFAAKIVRDALADTVELLRCRGFFIQVEHARKLGLHLECKLETLNHAVDRLVKDLELRDDPLGEAPFPLPVHPDQQGFDLVHSRDAPDIDLALSALRDAAGELPLIGEVYLPTERARRYLEHFDAAFAFDLLHAPPEPAEIAAAIERTLAVGSPAWVTSNHDFSRVATRWGPRNVRAAAVLLLTLGGPTFVYQGEELGTEDGPGADPPLDRFGRDAFRHPMRWDDSAAGGFTVGDPWLPAAPGPSVASQRDDGDSLMHLFRELIALRPMLRGPAEPVDAAPGTVAFGRGDLVVVVNLGDDAVPMPDGGTGPPLVSSDPGAVEGGRLAANAAVVLGRSPD